MAKHVLTATSVTVNGVDLTDHVESVSFIATTNSAGSGAPMGVLKDYDLAGTLKISDPQVTFFHDYASAKVYATLLAAYEARSTINVVAKADGGASTSPTNPQWTIPCFVKSWPLLAGARGERHMAPVTFGVAGEYSIATA